MRHVVSEVQKERLLVVRFDPLNRFGGVVGRDVIPAFDRLDDDFVVSHQRAAHLCVVNKNSEPIEPRRAEKVIKSLSIRHRLGVETGWMILAIERQVPLAEHTRAIAGVLEHFGHGDFIGVRHRMKSLDVVRLANSDRIRTGHQGGSRNTTHRLSVKAGETNSFGRHLIQIRCLDCLRSETAKVLVPLIVSKDQDDIGLRVRGDRDGLEAKDADEDDVFHGDPIFL